MKEDMIQFQIAVSTADDERMLFSGDISQVPSGEVGGTHFPSGTYRVIDGELFRLVPGIPLNIGTTKRV